MKVTISETVTVHPSQQPFSDDHTLSLSHIDTDRHLHVNFRYLRAYVNPPTANHVSDPFHVISSALSSTLVHYYPLAGTLRRRDSDGRLELRCTVGKGCPVIRATADRTLESVGYLNDPEGDFVERLVPEPDPAEILKIPMILQVTVFECGSYVLGTTVHHSMCDGLGASLFFNAMADVVRGASQIAVDPVWDRARLLRPREPPRLEFPVQEFLVLDKEFSPYSQDLGAPIGRVCFYVKEEWLDRFKEFLQERSGSKFTTFEALGAFIWRAKVKASGTPGEEKVKFAYSTNIRKVVKPPLPAGHWGNGCVPMFVQATAKELIEQPIWKTADLIKKSKYNIKDEYVRSFIDFQELNYDKGISAGKGVSGFTDWRHLSHHTIDFGSGGPVTVLPLTKHILGSVEPCYFLPYNYSKEGFNILLYLRETARADFRLHMEKLGKLEF